MLLFFIAAPLLAQADPLLAQISENTTDEATLENAAGQGNTVHVGGPSSVGAQLQKDDAVLQKAGPQAFKIRFKERLKQKYGLLLGADYQALYQHVNESPGDNDAAGGVFRIYGHWTPFNRAEPDSGSLVFKVENRHRLGTDIAPQALGPTAGIAGLTALTWSDAGNILTNLYWQQAFDSNRFAFNAGIVDVTDYLDVYGLVNNWTNFNNAAFSTSLTIPAPNQGLGTVMRWMFTPNYYVVGGIADANGDPSKPGDAFESFFDGEYFTHAELGWIGSWENRFSDNIHISAWHVDERDEAQVDSGWGVAFSFSRNIAERWLPFFRAGYSDGGGAVAERSISTGVGYQLKERADYIGVAANWVRAPAEASGGDDEDQYTFEAFYRFQVLPRVQIVPSVQLILDPAYEPATNTLWVPGVRLRAVL